MYVYWINKWDHIVGPIYWFHSQRQIACWDITETHIPSIYLYKRVLFQFTSGRSTVGGTIQKLPELRDSVSCLWTVVSAEEWKCFPLFWVKRTCSVGLPIIVPRAGKLDFQCHFSQKSTLFPLSLYLPVQKKKRKKFLFVMNRGQVSPWECSQKINILLQTVSQCHAARFTFHVGSLCGMRTDWDSHQGMTDLWPHRSQCQTN